MLRPCHLKPLLRSRRLSRAKMREFPKEEFALAVPAKPPICSIVKARMKKKPAAEPIISPQILEMAKKSLAAERPVLRKPCAVCGASCTPLTGPHPAEEDLCWVCRRLKISAWREADQQISAQE